MTREEAVARCASINENSFPTKGIRFDLMVGMKDNGRHCATCSCAGYVTYSGWTIAIREEDIPKFRKMSTTDRIGYAKTNIDLLFED